MDIDDSKIVEVRMSAFDKRVFDVYLAAWESLNKKWLSSGDDQYATVEITMSRKNGQRRITVHSQDTMHFSQKK